MANIIIEALKSSGRALVTKYLSSEMELILGNVSIKLFYFFKPLKDLKISDICVYTGIKTCFVLSTLTPL
jgi:hypothetical protein